MPKSDGPPTAIRPGLTAHVATTSKQDGTVIRREVVVEGMDDGGQRVKVSLTAVEFARLEVAMDTWKDQENGGGDQ